MNALSRARVLDALYGRTDFNEFEFGLISLPEIQRLRYIRMCNINSMLITGASEISRFEHTLGVMRLAQEWLESNKIDAENARALMAAAALHDAQTGPFGHSLQYVLVDEKVPGSFLHDDLEHGLSAQHYQQIQSNVSFAGRHFEAPTFLGSAWPLTSALIKGKGAFGPIISGTMDLDNIDNVVRLAFHCGLVEECDRRLGIELARSMRICARRISFDASALSAVERWQLIRGRLYQVLLLDWAEFSAKAMLTLAIELAVGFDLIGTDSWIRTDDELLDFLSSAKGESQAVAEVAGRLRRGELYSPVVLLESDFPKDWSVSASAREKRLFERELASYLSDAYGVRSKILVHYIADKGKTSRAVPILVFDTGQEIVVGSDSDRLLIGVFSSHSIAPATQSQFARDVLERLGRRGFKIRGDIADPLGEAEFDRSTGQMNLL